jgi:hypothetical protein
LLRFQIHFRVLKQPVSAQYLTNNSIVFAS